MKNFTKKHIRLRIDNSVIMIISASITIIILLIVLSVVFLSPSSGETNVKSNDDAELNIDDSSNIVSNKGSSKEFPVNGKVKLYRKEKNKVEELSIDDYIMGVVASEVPANFEEEALKAQAVAARTYYINKRINPCGIAKSKDAEICDTTDCQVYMDKEERLKSWSKSSAEANWSKIEEAVKSTSDEILTYDGEVLEYPQFFSTSSGFTEDAIDVFAVDVPYLKSKESKGEEIAPKFQSTVKISNSDFINKLTSKYPEIKLNKNNLKESINIKSYTNAGSVKEIEIGGVTLKGKEVRSALNLNSSNFEFKFRGNEVEVNCKGYGHGVGMSQWGANVMAKNGSSYKEILEYYYTDVDIEKIKYVNK